MKREYDVVIAGAGLGGLTAAALLSVHGFSTLVVEKLPRIGGRFTNIPYKGFQLTTGALHLIPHKRGSVKRILKDKLKSDLELIDASRIYFLLGGNLIDYFRSIPASIDSIFRFSLGIKFKETPILERLRFFIKIIAIGRPFLPKGGCISIIKFLEKATLDYGGEIVRQTSINQICIQRNRVVGVTLRTRNGTALTVKTPVVVSDIGPKNTLRMLPNSLVKEKFKSKIGKIRPVEGIKFSIESKKPVLEEITGEKTGILFTPVCRRIAGVVEPSSLDPDLAPTGKSLLMTHQKIMSSNIKKEISIGIKDLHEIIPNFKKDCRILAVQVFKELWPVNRARQGTDAPQITPIKGLYLVGDGAKPPGYIMAEGVMESAKRVVENILKSTS